MKTRRVKILTHVGFYSHLGGSWRTQRAGCLCGWVGTIVGDCTDKKVFRDIKSELREHIAANAKTVRIPC